MENALTTVDFRDAEVIKTLKATVAINATDAEFAMFSEFCKATGLNPFKKEIWFIKANNRLQMMTGINGFFTIANNNPEFDGYESGLIDPNGDYKTLTYAKDDYIGAWCKVHRKDRKIAAEGVAMVKEYAKDFGNWKTMRRVMIVKCAESVALRKAFPQQLNGLYTAEEMPPEYDLNKPKGRANPYDAPTERAVECSIKTEPVEKATKKQKLTMEAIEAGKSYIYDLNGIGNNCKDEEEKQAVWKIAVRDFGAVRVGLLCHCFQAIPDFYDHWVNEQDFMKADSGSLDYDTSSRDVDNDNYDKNEAEARR